MKRIDEMSREEIIALTDDQINILIDYECAIEGKPLLPIKPVEPQKVSVEADVEIYEVCGVVTTDIDHAARILTAAESGTLHKTDYDYGVGSEFTRLVPMSEYQKPEIKSRKVFSAGKWDEVRNAVNAYKTAKIQYEKDKKEYDEVASERSEISDRIWETVSEARNEEYRRERIKVDYDRYMQLAENNKTIAMNFLKRDKCARLSRQ
jgi:hypothetical protein